MNLEKHLLNLVILGGGPAGMAAALVAGRARLRTVVINAESPRNAVTHASHGFLTRDGAHPLELLAVAKEQLRKYASVTYVVGQAASVKRTAEAFLVGAADGQRWQARRLLIATGYRDDLSRLSLPGVESVYGRSVFPCPFCDGFEHADERLAVFMADGAEHFVPIVSVWSRDVIVFTNGRTLAAPLKEALLARGVGIEEARVAELVCADGQLLAVKTEDGRRVERDTGFIGDDYTVPATDFAATLGVPSASNARGMDVLEADDAGRTAVERLYLAGDARSAFGGLMAAAQQGSACAEHIVREIAQERWAR